MVPRRHCGERWVEDKLPHIVLAGLPFVGIDVGIECGIKNVVDILVGEVVIGAFYGEDGEFCWREEVGGDDVGSGAVICGGVVWGVVV